MIHPHRHGRARPLSFRDAPAWRGPGIHNHHPEYGFRARAPSRHCEPTGRANARPMTGSAKQSISQQTEAWIASSLSLLAMTTVGCNFAFPRRDAPESCQGSPSKTRGRRECRVRAAPAVSYANGESGCAHEHTGSAEASGIPCVMVLRLMPRSPRRRIRLVTVVGGFSDGSTRSGLNCHRRLGTSNGCQDHTVLPYATTSFVLRACNRSRGSTRPATAIRADALASTTSHPAFVTTRDRPSCRNGTAAVKPLIWALGEAESCPSCHSAATRRAIVRFTFGFRVA